MLGKKVLVVDDEKNVVRLLEVELSTEGFQVITALSGNEAITKTREQKPDLIIRDIMMPEMNGGEAFKQILDDPQCIKPPVIFLTAALTPREAKNHDLGININHHAYETIAKPFSPKELLQTINRLILKNPK